VVKGDGGYLLIQCLVISPTRAPSFRSQAGTLALRMRRQRIDAAVAAARQRATELAHAEFNPAGLAADATPGALIYRIGDECETMSDYRRWVAGQPPEVVEYYGRLENRVSLCRGQYELGLLVALARHEGLDRTPEFRRRRDDYRRLLLAEHLVQRTVKQKAAEPRIEEEILRRYHEQHEGFFVEPFRVEVDQVRVSWPERGKGEPVAQRIAAAERRAEAVAARLRQGATAKDLRGENVNWYSAKAPQSLDDLSQAVRGLLQHDVQYASLPVLDATPGKVYGPVEQDNHFLVVRLRSITPARFLSYEESRAQVEAAYRSSLIEDFTMQDLAGRLQKANFRFLTPARRIL